MTKLTDKTMLWLHIFFWFAFFLFPCLHLFGYMPDYGPREWLQFAYFIPSSLVTFYAVFYFTQRYMDRYYLYFVHDQGFFKKAGWLMKWPTMMVLLVFGANLCSWLLLGNNFYEVTLFRQEEGSSFLEEEFTRALLFTAAGVFYGYVKWTWVEGDKELARLKKEEAKLQEEYERLMQKIAALPDEERAEFLKRYHSSGFRLKDKLGGTASKN
jgi:hypothetical protein